ncbi:MAG: 4Fe-4S binding protein [Chloroflexi bacterium]|nr:4Fe-4S binding protein [Chloroflexota bacterium]
MPEGASSRGGWSPRRWLTLRRIIQYTALLLFVVIFVWSRRGGWPGEVVNIPLRLDPLAMLMQTLASRTLLAGSALALITVALALVFGRAWCGWLCPLGTVLQSLSLDRWRIKSKGPGDSWRKTKYGLLLLVLSAALFGNLTLLIFDPLTVLFRTLSINVWPAVDQIVRVVENALYRVSWLQGAVFWFDSVVRPRVLPPDPAFYRDAMLYAGVFAGIVLLNLLAERFWCRYFCPLGAFLGLLGKVGVIRRKVNDKCLECNKCVPVCPTGTVTAAKRYASDPGECTMCLECLAACPFNAIEFPAHRSAAEWRGYDPGRRQAIVSLGAAVAGIGLVRSDQRSFAEHPFLVQPPGARENNLLSRCIRCGECMRACPTSAIQPAIGEAGLEGLWTPVVVSRLGYCIYSCNACGQVCPTQAIPPLSVPEKQKKVIGLAYIDKDRCIPWADYRPCIICEEMCPIPHKAIKLERVELTTPDGDVVSLQQPYVIRERCIGCGICETKCPVNGEAAIRIYVPGRHDERF